MALVSLYRPPSCVTEDFEKALDKIKNWISDIETKNSKLPTLTITGDFNFPQMKTWSHLEISDFLDKIHNRESDNQTIGAKTTQTKLLCEFTQDHYLHQYIDGTTRKKNLLTTGFEA